MNTYARIAGGIVAEIIQPMTYGENSPAGIVPPYQATDEIPIAERFHPEFLALLVLIPAGVSPEVGWAYDGSSFSPASS